ncbi:hypothetical protein LZC95_31500 [Pendulispora brunnea]|uniref:Uncharacterized protein n=1 Tax=Pendulispora brunnea TaxID=2905690 RepID=A0ABZ2K0T9_9BACT
MDSLPPLTPPPPMSTSSLPPEVRPITIAPRALIKPPVLASDILREEVAPMAPAQRAMRIWLLGFALAFAAVGVASRLGFGPSSLNVLTGSLATAAVALLATFLPAPYAARASLAIVAGVVPLGLGAMGEGPLAALGFEGGLRGTAGLVLITLLPGSLLFRARYRAFRVARIILALTILLSVPALVSIGMGALDGATPLLLRIANGAALLASLTAFCGFMGEETTGGCGGWALLVIFAQAARLGLHTLGKGSELYGHWGFVVGAIGVFAAGVLVAFAIFQLLAVAFARQARKVDVHRIVGPGAEDRPPLTSMTSE